MLLDEFATGHSEDTVVTIYGGRRFTYRDYMRGVAAFNNHIKQYVYPKMPVALYMDDSPLEYCAFFSILSLDAVPFIISPKTLKSTLIRILQKAHCQLIIGNDASIFDAREYGYIRAEGFSDGSPISFVDTVLIKPFVPDRNDSPNTVFYLGLTSGSSGEPKLVMHSIEEMRSAIENYAKKTLKIGGGDVLFSIPKSNFAYGLANNLFFSFGTGATAILYPGSLSDADILQYSEEYDVTYFFAVPTLYKRLLSSALVEVLSRSFSRVKMFISAGEYLPRYVAERWNDVYGKYIVDSVGCSETGSAYLVNMDAKNKCGSAGIPVSGYTLRLIGEDGTPSETFGRLTVESKSNSIGYYREPLATAEKIRNGIIYTEDIFRIDQDGYFWFHGRADQMVKRNGYWVSLTETAEAIESCSGVEDVAVFKVDEENALCAAVICNPGVRVSSADIIAQLQNQLEHYKIPDSIRVVDKLPTNTNGKFDIAALKALWRELANGPVTE